MTPSAIQMMKNLVSEPDRGMLAADGAIDMKAYFTRRLIVHPHLAKTGGTSFVSGLTAIFGEERVYDLRGGKPSLAQMERKDLVRIGVLSGHFWFDTQERPIARKKVYFMNFRHPVDRFISLYNFVANSTEHPGHHKYGVLDIEGAFNYLKEHNPPAIANTISLMFGPRAKAPPRMPGRIVKKGQHVPFEVARDRMEECFALVIPMKRVDDALKGIAQVFGRGEMEFGRENVGSKKVKTIPDHVREELIAMNSEDMKLIGHFEAVFESRLADLKNRLLR